jgi:hypothetical protein
MIDDTKTKMRMEKGRAFRQGQPKKNTILPKMRTLRGVWDHQWEEMRDVSAGKRGESS